MATGFSRDRRGRLALGLDDGEAAILGDLVRQLVDLVRPEDPAEGADPLAVLVGIDVSAEVPDDPALLRLFPQAYPDDAEASADFRRFTERSLREQRLERAQVVSAWLAGHPQGGPVEAGDAQAWLGVTNDLRLVLGARLGIDDDDQLWREGLDGDGHQAMLLYDWLTWLQDGLVGALTGP